MSNILTSRGHLGVKIKETHWTHAYEYGMKRVWHVFHEACHSVTFYIMKKDSKRCCDTTTPESIQTKDESKRGSAFAFIFGVN